MTVSTSKPRIQRVVEGISIRAATLTDATRISELGTQVFTATFGHSVEPHELQSFLQEFYTVFAISQDIEDDTKDVMVATNQKDEILGFVYLARGTGEPCIDNVNKNVELQRLYVDLSAHGKGIGRSLVSTVENMAKEQGFSGLWLGVWEENYNAMKLYEKWGYQRVGEHDFVLGTVVQTDFILLKSLEAKK